MVQCCVYGCGNKSGDKTKFENRKFLRHYRFPKDPELQKEWMLRTERFDLKEIDPSNSWVCSEHFDDGDFEESNFLRSKLFYYNRMQIPIKLDAVPKIDEAIVTGMTPVYAGMHLNHPHPLIKSNTHFCVVIIFYLLHATNCMVLDTYQNYTQIKVNKEQNSVKCFVF